MARNGIAPTIIAAFSVAFWGLDSLEAFLASHSQQISPRHGAHAATAGAFFSAALTAFALALLLLFAYVRALSRGNAPAGGAAGDRFVRRLTEATLAATMASLIAGTALRLGGGGGEAGLVDMK